MSNDIKAYLVKLSDLIPDAKNANLGTERGRYMIDQSLTEVGAGRSLVSDRNNRVPAGNKTLEAAVEAGFEDAIVVESDGKRLVVVKRTDWDLEDGDPNNPARRYAYWDNRTAQVDLEWNAGQISADIESGLDLGAMFTGEELMILVEDADPLSLDDENGNGAQGNMLSCPKCGFVFHVES